MSGDDQFSAILYLLMLILPLSALLSRQLPIGRTLRMAAMWAAIFAIALVLATLWSRNRPYVDGFLADAGLTGNLVTGTTVTLVRGEGGHFWANVSINGISRRMLVDTGATNTAITRETAKAAGIKIDETFGVMVETANGTVIDHRATIDKFDLATIHAREVPVLVGDNLGSDLLGIDFLSGLKSWRAEGNRLILEPHPRQSDLT
ncbi:MAG: TIGR02281 family clan AA aspartic protease [Sphingomonas sp.]|nr:TIGR02281 family clan AA aspartic protease [Sphingomonas sp.]